MIQKQPVGYNTSELNTIPLLAGSMGINHNNLYKFLQDHSFLDTQNLPRKGAERFFDPVYDTHGKIVELKLSKDGIIEILFEIAVAGIQRVRNWN